MEDGKSQLNIFFSKKFNQEALVEIFAPGRANLIGEHTDYNLGYVLPFAIDLGVWFCAAFSKDSTSSIYSFDKHEMIEFDHIEEIHGLSPQWSKFFMEILKSNHGRPFRPFKMVFGGNLPIGAGLSSSSAITCGFLSCINKLFSWDMSPVELLQGAIKAERGSGVDGGIMDQFTILNARKNQLNFLDCKTNEVTYLPFLEPSYSLYLFNSQVNHNLIDTEYNDRKKSCDNIVKILQNCKLKIESIRDVLPEDLVATQAYLTEHDFKMLSFVVLENQRVLSSVECIKNHEYRQLGSLLFASHLGLSKDYNVSCEELDWLVQKAINYTKILGARMMGGGFGGCTINLVEGHLDHLELESIKSLYNQKFGLELQIFEISAHAGILYNR